MITETTLILGQQCSGCTGGGINNIDCYYSNTSNIYEALSICGNFITQNNEFYATQESSNGWGLVQLMVLIIQEQLLQQKLVEMIIHRMV